jgi:hypothetical protein
MSPVAQHKNTIKLLGIQTFISADNVQSSPSRLPQVCLNSVTLFQIQGHGCIRFTDSLPIETKPNHTHSNTL